MVTLPTHKSRDSDEATADVLGLADEELRASPLGLVNQIKRGLPVASLERVSRRVAPEDGAFRYRIVAKPTLARRKAGARRLSTEESERLVRLARIWGLALDVWGGDDAARQFLFRTHPMLERHRPIDVALETEVGAQLVESILGGLEHGTAA